MKITTHNINVNTNDNVKEENTMKSVFETLNAINVNEHTEKKNGLTYLSWAWAWGELKKRYPDSNFIVYERGTEYGPVNYFTDGKTCWVKTGVFVNGLEHLEMLPVMDFKNRAIPLDQVTSTDVNKAIQRSLTKAVARHGLGLYIYAGEDLPEEDREKAMKPVETEQPKSRVDAVKGLCTSIGITMAAFGQFRNSAVLAGVIPDRKVNDLSNNEFDMLLNFVEKNAALPA